MREFAKFATGFWTSRRIQAFSDDGKLLAAYLISGPHSNMAGVYRLPFGYVLGDLRWPSERVEQGFIELAGNDGKGFAYRCEATEYVVVMKSLQHTPPENPNQLKHVATLLAQVPRDALILPYISQALRDCLGEVPKILVDALAKGSSTLRQQREGEGEGNKKEKEKKKSAGAPKTIPVKPVDVSESIWNDFTALRKAKRAPLTETALEGIQAQAALASMTLEAALRMCCERGWQGFKADWVRDSRLNGSVNPRAAAAASIGLGGQEQGRVFDGTSDRIE